jgi:hypothetical protein
VIDGPQVQTGLHFPKRPFHLPQTLVGHRHFFSGHGGVRFEYPFAVVFRFPLYSLFVYPYALFVFYQQEPVSPTPVRWI